MLSVYDWKVYTIRDIRWHIYWTFNELIFIWTYRCLTVRFVSYQRALHLLNQLDKLTFSFTTVYNNKKKKQDLASDGNPYPKNTPLTLGITIRSCFLRVLLNKQEIIRWWIQILVYNMDRWRYLWFIYQFYFVRFLVEIRGRLYFELKRI